MCMGQFRQAVTFFIQEFFFDRKNFAKECSCVEFPSKENLDRLFFSFQGIFLVNACLDAHPLQYIRNMTMPVRCHEFSKFINFLPQLMI